MTRYIFSKGEIRVDEHVRLSPPRKRRHPLRRSPLLLCIPMSDEEREQSDSADHKEGTRDRDD